MPPEDCCLYCLISAAECRELHQGAGLLASDHLGGVMLRPDCCTEYDPDLAADEGLVQD